MENTALGRRQASPLAIVIAVVTIAAVVFVIIKTGTVVSHEVAATPSSAKAEAPPPSLPGEIIYSEDWVVPGRGVFAQVEMVAAGENTAVIRIVGGKGRLASATVAYDGNNYRHRCYTVAISCNGDVAAQTFDADDWGHKVSQGRVVTGIVFH